MEATLTPREVVEWRAYYAITGQAPDSVERTLAGFASMVSGMVSGKPHPAHVFWPAMKPPKPKEFHERTPEEQHDLIAQITHGMDSVRGKDA